MKGGVEHLVRRAAPKARGRRHSPRASAADFSPAMAAPRNPPRAGPRRPGPNVPPPPDGGRAQGPSGEKEQREIDPSHRTPIWQHSSGGGTRPTRSHADLTAQSPRGKQTLRGVARLFGGNQSMSKRRKKKGARPPRPLASRSSPGLRRSPPPAPGRDRRSGPFASSIPIDRRTTLGASPPPPPAGRAVKLPVRGRGRMG